MIGVLVKSGSTVVEKQVFSGDDEKGMALISRFQASNPTLTCEVHKDTDPDWATAFEQMVATPRQTPEQAAWLLAKASGPSAAVTFIARKLGLE